MSPSAVPADEAFWCGSEAEAFTRLQSGPGGLTRSEAQRRLRLSGRNSLTAPPSRRLIGKLLRRLTEPLTAILIVAAVVAGGIGDFGSTGIVLSILAVSIVLELSQEHTAERAVEALNRSVAVHASVCRDGRFAETPVEEIVPGDVIALSAGDLVPADGIVIEAHAAQTNEALLTGESFPVDKRPGPCAAAAPGEAFNALFGGTALVRGTASMLVTATGARTRFGAIAAALTTAEPARRLDLSLRAFGLLILRITGLMVLIVLLAHLAAGRAVIESFLFAVALAVGLTPELLPMIMTVTLSRGAVRMAARKVVVKRLAAIHDLGAMTVLCTDKTGTLTSARIVLAGHPGPDGIDRPRVLELAAVNSGFESRLKSPLDDAILAAAPASVRAAWTFIADVPFDFDRRRASVLAARAGERILIVKGAPEEVLALSTQVDSGKETVPIDPERRAAVATLIRDYAAQGLRCLGIAWRAMGDASLTEKDERDLVFAGLCVFADPPKPDAGTAIRRLEAAGVRVKIVSGDAPETVLHLVDALGVKARGVLTGKEIAALNDTALALKVRTADVFARVSPDQKTRVIRALQATGDVVGFIGDGINDAPALHAADVGLAVEGATEVARAAADIIMLEAGLGVIAAAVEEGRRTDANIRKYLRMGTSSNFGNMLSMAVASLFIPFLPMTPVQVLLNNLLYDLSEVGIPYDSVERTQLRRPYGFEMRELLRFTLIMGPLSSLFDIGVFVLLLQVFHVSPEIFRTAWFAESIATQILVVFVIRTAVPVWKGRPHPWLMATSLGALAIALGIALTPLGRPFGFVPVPLPVLLALLALTAAYLVSAEAMKASAMKRLRRRRAQPT